MARNYLVLGRLLEAMQRTNSLNGRLEARKASVAAIFRLAHPHAYVFPHIPPTAPVKSVADLMRYFKRIFHTEQGWTEEANLELLFIKRSETPLDRHSGQIAFPGGKKEAHETDYDCAVRETR